MKKRSLHLLLCLTLALGLLTSAASAAGTPVSSSNKGKQSYQDRWSSTVKSYLYENPSGGVTRVEYTGGSIVVEDYDSEFRFLSGRTLEPELPVWGGFFAGEDSNFIIVGQDNVEENDSKEVVRVIRYDKDWNRLGHASLCGANTIHPFDAGSLRCAEYGGELYIRTCHEMYTSSDGLNHQASMTLAVRESDMQVADAWYDVMNVSCGYVSHSFNQFVLVDNDTNIVCLDHGDAYPRSIILMRYGTKAGSGVFSADYYNKVSTATVQSIEGRIGDNTTGTVLGGLAETSSHYLAAYAYDGQGGGGSRTSYLAAVSRNGLSVSVKALPFPAEKNAPPPVLAPTGAEGGYVLWNAKGDSTLRYVSYIYDGTIGSEKTAADVPLSDCQPILYQGRVVWYTTDRSAPVFYALDNAGVRAYGTEPEAETVPSATPTPTTTPTATPAATTTQQAGTVAGDFYSTDILTTVNGAPVDAINVGGRTLVCAEKLDSCGFRVTWDNAARTLQVARSSAQPTAAGSAARGTQTPGTRLGSYYYTDIVTYLDGKPIVAYNTGGRTWICAEDMEGWGYQVTWDGESRTLSVRSPLK